MSTISQIISPRYYAQYISLCSRERRDTLRRDTLSPLYYMFIVSALLCALGCTQKQKKVITPGPPIPNVNLSGGYDCPHFGFMKLRQTKGIVRGSYEGLRRNGDNGTIQGKIDGDILWVDWIQPGNLEAAVLPKKGKGWLRISEGGSRLEGEWGYDESKDNGGVWIATRSEFY